MREVEAKGGTAPQAARRGEHRPTVRLAAFDGWTPRCTAPTGAGNTRLQVERVLQLFTAADCR